MTLARAPPQTDEACCAKTSLSFRPKPLAEGQWLRTRPFETLAPLSGRGPRAEERSEGPGASRSTGFASALLRAPE